MRDGRAKALLLGVALASCWLGARPAGAAEWTAELFFAGAANADSRLEIEQAGEPDLDFTARWATRPFEQPLSWALRLGREGERHGWALELYHHKIYLENGPPEVESFSVTHGTNLITVQHAWIRPRWCFRALAGVVVAHPENTVRGRRWPEDGGLFGKGYHLAGPVLGGGAGVTLPVAGPLGLAAELRLTHAWLSVDVVEGKARTRNLAVHFLLGPRLAI